VADLIGTLDVEERVRAKATHGKGVESSSANSVQKKIPIPMHLIGRKRKRKRGQSRQPIRRRKKGK
jgi:hypothetical protein